MEKDKKTPVKKVKKVTKSSSKIESKSKPKTKTVVKKTSKSRKPVADVKKIKPRKRRKKAFTLIEILAVMVILGIIALIAVPIVSNYISDSRTKTYMSHESTMREAARSMVVECIDGKEECDLPQTNQTREIYLDELIDKGFSQKLQNPQTGGYCNSALSYVRIHNTGNSNYEFEACLYCGNYVTESDNCAKIDNSKDKTPPTCGNIEGESSEWINSTRTIVVECRDTDSGCLRDKFSRTFRESTVDSTIEISDKAGNVTSCPVSVKLDKTTPTCELEVEGGTPEANGWISGNVKVKIKSKMDGQSGLLTYGIGTSINPDYNRKTELDLTNVNGLVTVFGYVKDNAGNEGVCSRNLRTGIQRPDFDIYYGYQIFPLKDEYTSSGLTVGDNSVTTTSNTPVLEFNNMVRYTNAKKVVIISSDTIDNPSSFKLSVNNGSSYIEAYKKVNSDGKTRLEFDLDKGTYNSYRFILGNVEGRTINIERIEIQNTNNRIKTNKLVTVNLHPVIEKERVKTTGYSFDNGNTFQQYYYQSFNTIDHDVYGNAQTRNDVPMTSDKKQYSIIKGDGEPSTISLSVSTTDWTNQNVVLTGRGMDTDSGLVAYGFSASNYLQYYSSGWTTIENTKGEVTYTNTVTVNGSYFFNLKDDAGNINFASKNVTNIDKKKPECSIENNSTIKCTDTATSEYAASSIDGYIFGKDANSNGTYTSVSATNSLSVNATVNASGTWNLYARDRAGNISNVASYNYYTITYDKNGGSSCTKSSEILRSGRAVDLTPTCSRTGYTFKGWMNSSGTKVTSMNISSNTTLYAIWDANVYSITYDYTSGATSGVPNSYTYSVGATINGKPTKSGYTFNGWTYGSTKAFSHTISTTDTGNKSFTTNWCQNCASVSNGSCTLNANTAGSCTYTTSCNTGFHHKSGQNTRTPVCEADCKSGWTYSNGKCVKTYTATLKYKCDSGWSLSGTTCSKTSTQNASVYYTCPSGGSLSGTTCTKTTSYRCCEGEEITLSNGTTDCFEGSTHMGDGASCTRTGWSCTRGTSSHCYNGNISAITQSGCRPSSSTPHCDCRQRKGYSTCYSSSSYTATTNYSCPSGWSRSGSKCSKTDTKAATSYYECNSGDSLSGSTCTNTYTP